MQNTLFPKFALYRLRLRKQAEREKLKQGDCRKAEDAADSHGYSAACQKRCHNTCGYFTPERHASWQGFTLLAGTGQIWRIDTPLAALNSFLG
jgi:ribosome modulation factor